ncbi:ubiquitin-transferase domain-containing protein [Cyclospora cayetanensis]|uniref:Ubiquitin-transferase domain-containing protein n=1 Tax=Cyclospora cayetanensis TaxID=88456 RepID=A0A1D3DAH3_9EIME|nr:ubiquitin-transferase domain-containing protein [Cyclospora cayetanensis]
MRATNLAYKAQISRDRQAETVTEAEKGKVCCIPTWPQLHVQKGIWAVLVLAALHGVVIRPVKLLYVICWIMVFTTSSVVYGHFLEVLVEFNSVQRAAFLKFVTGSTILPAGGFAGFRPLMKVVRKLPTSGSGGSDGLLPSVMTCSNYIKLPDYSSKQILKERLLLALAEGQGAFTLS